MNQCEYLPTTIPTYAINLEERVDRYENIKIQFAKKNEFDLTIVNAIKNKNGALGLWQTIIQIIDIAKEQHKEYLLFVEDDHQFTKNYNPDKLNEFIHEAVEMGADVLLGGVSWYKTALQVSDNLFWIDKFTGTQFLIVFNKFFDSILNYHFVNGDTADSIISKLTNKQFVIYPFISTQKEFGYSDVTTKNNVGGYVTDIFKKTQTMFNQLEKVKEFYGDLPTSKINFSEDELNEIVIPTYIINLKERTQRLEHIEQQFADKPEFAVNIIDAYKHKIGAVGLWLSIIKVINLAIQNEDDVIVICEDDHEFTKDYSRFFLLRNIIEANEQGADILSGGSGGFGQAVPLTTERYWINPMLSTQFIVVYSKFFKQILDYKFKRNDTADEVISKLTSHKMLLCPSISIQKDFGYSDTTEVTEKRKGLVTSMFKETALRLQNLRNAYLTYNKKPINYNG